MNQCRVETWRVARAIMSMIKAAGTVNPQRIPKTESPWIIWLKTKPTKIQSVDHIWTAFKETMPSTPASSAFNLNPAGFPINHTHPERKNVENSCMKFKTERQIGSLWYKNVQPTKFPRRISTTKVDHIECLCIAAFSTYSTHDSDLEHKRTVLNMEKT